MAAAVRAIRVAARRGRGPDGRGRYLAAHGCGLRPVPRVSQRADFASGGVLPEFSPGAAVRPLARTDAGVAAGSREGLDAWRGARPGGRGDRLPDDPPVA